VEKAALCEWESSCYVVLIPSPGAFVVAAVARFSRGVRLHARRQTCRAEVQVSRRRWPRTFFWSQ